MFLSQKLFIKHLAEASPHMKIDFKSPKQRSLLIWWFASLSPNLLGLAVFYALSKTLSSYDAAWFFFDPFDNTMKGYLLWAVILLPGTLSLLYLPANAKRSWKRIAVMILVYILVTAFLSSAIIGTTGCQLFGPCNKAR